MPAFINTNETSVYIRHLHVKLIPGQLPNSGNSWVFIIMAITSNKTELYGINSKAANN